ncbi:DUF2059 domain-containing protein [Sphingomonas hankookensis]|uniref:DUF2059 domain-containing protein n=1 Tax=Sphingomonas hankookensis TaxID=563996 RepID=UPI001F567F1D|nr:DUF2059 domain-containing protein [Sphingomonas hankookensis]
MKSLFLAAALLGAAPALAQAPAAPATTQPVDPARLALAERTVAVLVPEGVYLRMMRDQFPAMMNAMLGSFMDTVPGGPEKLRDADPAFKERMRIMTKVMGEELGPLMARLEPSLRTGMARSLSKRFTAQQLTDLDAFFATPSGKAFGNEFMLLFTEPEIMAEMMKMTPVMLQEMPNIMKKVEAATAHLPQPPKPKGDKQ